MEISRSLPEVYGTRKFMRFAAQEGLARTELCAAAAWIEAGRIDADLGGGVIKQRLPRKGQGKSGGYRAIVLFRRGRRMVFAFGFAKKDRDNIGPDDLKSLRRLADRLLELRESDVRAAIMYGEIEEIDCDG